MKIGLSCRDGESNECCVGAWSLHPAQIEIAKKIFSPPPDEVKFAMKVLEALPDGRGELSNRRSRSLPCRVPIPSLLEA